MNLSRSVWPLAFALAGCSSDSSRIADDREHLDGLLGDRVGLELPDARADEQAIEDAVRALLSASLDEQRAVKIAVLNNRNVRARLADLGVASWDLVQAGLVHNPVFALDAKFNGGHTQIEVGLMQPFIDLFFLSARKIIAEAEFEATRSDIASELVRLSYDVRRAFVRVQAAQRVLQLDDSRASTAEAASQLMQDLHAAGNVTALSPAFEALESARAQLARQRSVNELQEARESLSTLMGLWGDALDWILEGALPDPSAASVPADLEQLCLAVSFELSATHAEATAQARRAGISGWESAFATGTARGTPSAARHAAELQRDADRSLRCLARPATGTGVRARLAHDPGTGLDGAARPGRAQGGRAES